MRLLAAVRLSHLTDNTTSPEGQTTGIDQYVKQHGHTVVKWTEDLDVSGGKPIRDRPDIGLMLTPEHLNEWDGIIGYKLDRLFRDQLDFLRFEREFCRPNGKVIISVSEGVDTSTTPGRQTANRYIEFAETELEHMRERRRDAAKRIRQAARWNGGRVPYGYKPEKMLGGFILVPDANYTKHVDWLADKIISGMSANRLTMTLNELYIPTSQDAERIRRYEPAHGSKWTVHQVLLLLRSPHIRGYVQHWPQPGKPVIVRDADGTPIQREPIITDEKWAMLQAALDRGSQNRTQVRSDAATLLQVAFCRKCKRPLWANKQRENYYYRCAGKAQGLCDSRNIRQDRLEAFVNKCITEHAGDVQRKITRTVGEDHTADIAKIQQSIADIESLVTSGDMPASSAARMLTKLEGQLEHLESLPKPETVEESAGETMLDYWQRCERNERRQFLLDTGCKVYADHIGARFETPWGNVGETDPVRLAASTWRTTL